MRRTAPILLLLLLLLLAKPALAHEPPALTLSVRITEEEMTIEGAYRAEIFRDWLDIEPDVLDTVTKEEYPALRAEVERFLEGACTVEVDGVPVKGRLARIRTRSFDDHGYQWIYVDLRAAYALLGKPRRITIRWTRFEDDVGLRVSPIDGEIDAFGEEDYLEFREREPEFTWHAPLTPRAPETLPAPVPMRAHARVPVLSAAAVLLLLGALVALFARGASRRAKLGTLAAGALIAAALSGTAKVEVTLPFAPRFTMPDRAGARAVFESLHRNIYRAFDYESEDDVYDTLARSVTGNLLDRVYAEVYQSLILRDQGGAVCRIQATEILESEVTIPPDPEARSFDVRCRWRVRGKVGHFGHTHIRVNEYLAKYTVRCGEAGWRIAAVQALDQKRVER